MVTNEQYESTQTWRVQMNLRTMNRPKTRDAQEKIGTCIASLSNTWKYVNKMNRYIGLFGFRK